MGLLVEQGRLGLHADPNTSPYLDFMIPATCSAALPTARRSGCSTMASGPVGVIGFLVVTILWLAFGAALVLSPGILHNLWQSLRALRLPVQMIVWALLLPWVLGLWICLCSWPSWLRLLLVVGLGIATVGVFFPRQQQGLVAL